MKPYGLVFFLFIYYIHLYIILSIMNPQNIEIMGDDCTNQAWSEKSNSKEAIVENLKNFAKILIV